MGRGWDTDQVVVFWGLTIVAMVIGLVAFASKGLIAAAVACAVAALAAAAFMVWRLRLRR